MAVKPEIKLAENQSFQHPSGKFDKKVKARDLRENPNMVRNFPYLFKNVVEMQREDSLKGSASKNTSDIVIAQKITIKSTNETRVIIAAAPKKAVSSNRSDLDNLARSLNAQNARNIEAAKPAENSTNRNFVLDQIADGLNKKRKTKN